MEELIKGTIYNFDIIDIPAFQERYENYRYLDITSYDIPSNLGVDIQELHTRGTANPLMSSYKNPSDYEWVRFRGRNNNDLWLPLPWIIVGSITTVSQVILNIKTNKGNKTASDVIELLQRNGYTNISVTESSE